jgi:calcineurin-like phosphoesterase family protein
VANLKTFVTSDLHFHHANILKYCPRPYESKDDMDMKLIEMFQEKVSEEDHVYHLGDFMFGHPKPRHFLELFEEMPGNWHFILGNHDKHNLEKWKPTLLKHPQIKEIEFYKRLKYNNMMFILFHYEIKAWEDRGWRDRSPERRKYDAVYHLFGHSHSSPDRVYEQDSMDVGIDATNYQLLTIEEIVEKINQQST